jgi:hypothetical protein
MYGRRDLVVTFHFLKEFFLFVTHEDILNPTEMIGILL